MKSKCLVKALLLAIFFVLILSSCQKNSLFYEFKSLDVWSVDQKLCFEDSLVFLEHPSKEMTLTLYVRNDNSYPYTQLGIYVDIYLPDTTLHQFVDFNLCDEKGKWTGAGWGSLFTHKLVLQKLPPANAFNIELSHAMQDPLLKGIREIGIGLTYDWADSEATQIFRIQAQKNKQQEGKSQE